jgi:hypothetical protein
VQTLQGRAGDARWELETETLARTATSKQVSGEKRLYAVVDNALVYAQELAVDAGDFRAHLSARLNRMPAVTSEPSGT